MYELIISEKPQAAAKIASALADTKPNKNTKRQIAKYCFFIYTFFYFFLVSKVSR